MKLNKAQFLVIIQFVLFGFFVGALLLLQHSATSRLRMIGLMMAFIGPIFSLIAIREHSVRNTIMPRVVPTPNSKAGLIESGPYKTIRHPIYTGVILTTFGTAIAHGHVIIMVMSVGILIFFFVKSGYEEKLLEVAYPDYAKYRKRSGRFLPWVG